MTTLVYCRVIWVDAGNGGMFRTGPNPVASGAGKAPITRSCNGMVPAEGEPVVALGGLSERAGVVGTVAVSTTENDDSVTGPEDSVEIPGDDVIEPPAGAAGSPADDAETFMDESECFDIVRT